MAIGLVSLTACARTQFSALKYTNSPEQNSGYEVLNKDIGVIHYPPKPFLLVTRPQNKDGATNSKIIYLPDLSRPMAMRVEPGLGSSDVDFKLVNGMISSIDQSFDAQLDELLTAAGAAATGAGALVTAQSGADLKQAEIQAILSGIRGEAGLRSGGTSSLDPCEKDDVFERPADHPGFSEKNVDSIYKSAQLLVCVGLKLGVDSVQFDDVEYKLEQGSGVADVTTPDDGNKIVEIALDLLLIPRSEFQNGDTAKTLRLVGVNTSAGPISVLVGSLPTLDLPDTEPGKEVKHKYDTAIKELNDVVRQLTPPAAPVDPFELYEIRFEAGKISLVRITETRALIEDRVAGQTTDTSGAQGGDE